MIWFDDCVFYMTMTLTLTSKCRLLVRKYLLMSVSQSLLSCCFCLLYPSCPTYHFCRFCHSYHLSPYVPSSVLVSLVVEPWICNHDSTIYLLEPVKHTHTITNLFRYEFWESNYLNHWWNVAVVMICSRTHFAIDHLSDRLLSMTTTNDTFTITSGFVNTLVAVPMKCLAFCKKKTNSNRQTMFRFKF